MLNGGPGGHKGVESIIAALGSRDFARIRIGVAGRRRGMDPRSTSCCWISLPRIKPIVEEAITKVEAKAVPFLSERGSGGGDEQVQLWRFQWVLLLLAYGHDLLDIRADLVVGADVARDAGSALIHVI